jgi:hypothetical protein
LKICRRSCFYEKNGAGEPNIRGEAFLKKDAEDFFTSSPSANSAGIYEEGQEKF